MRPVFSRIRLLSKFVDLEMSSAKIVIIGAGAAGVAAATKLLERGFTNLVLLEAESRIGGRIHTVPFADNVVDLGAQWCHGEKDNVVYQLVKDRNVLQSSGKIYEDYQCIRSNGEVLADDLTERLKTTLDEYVNGKEEDLKDYGASLGTYLNEKFNACLKRPENADIDKKVASEFLKLYTKFEMSLECCDNLFEVSGKGHLEYWNCEGDLLWNWKDQGYFKFIQLLLKSNGSNDFGTLNRRVLLNRQVTEIQWDKSGVERTKVKCSDGIVIDADHVISTVSLGVLKERHSKIFNPSLPNQKIRAIEGLAIGVVNKIFLEFPTQFWPDGWTGFCCLWRDEDLEELRASDRAWLEDVFGFYIVCSQPRILSSWVVGHNARYVETLPKDVFLKGIMYLLRRFLDWTVPDPINFISTAWGSNPNFRGSYSHRSMYSDILETSAKDLGAPITSVSGRPILQFCGEATSDHHYSTVHGAVESGWREAERLSEFYSTRGKGKL